MRLRKCVTPSAVLMLGAIAVAGACGGNTEPSKTNVSNDGGSGGSAGSTGGSSGSTSEAGPPDAPATLACTPLNGPVLGGFVECREDIVHRPLAEACGPPLAELPP